MYNVTLNVQFDGVLPKTTLQHVFRVWKGNVMALIVSDTTRSPAGYDDVQYLGEINAAERAL